MTSETEEGYLRSFTSGWDMFGWQEFQYSLQVVLKAFQHNLAHASIRFSTRHEVEAQASAPRMRRFGDRYPNHNTRLVKNSKQ